MKSTAVTTGTITADTQIKPVGTKGMVTYAEATGDTLILYDGDSSGTIICQLAAGDKVSFTTPVRFTNGLYANVGVAGPATVHIG